MPGQMPVQLTAHAYSSSKTAGFCRVFGGRDCKTLHVHQPDCQLLDGKQPKYRIVR